MAGDDYQHLLAWREALDLLRPGTSVVAVRVEDEEGGSVDDVTITHAPDSGRSDRFFQVKYHVDQRRPYSTDVLMEKKAEGGTSLLQKFWRTYRGLAARDVTSPELTLVSNWVWDPADRFAAVIDGHDGRINEAFLEATPGSELGRVRARWQAHLSASDAELALFVRALRVRTGYHCWSELRAQVAERMENRGLLHDEAALHTALGIVREWIMRGPSTIDVDTLREAVARNRLEPAAEPERATLVVLNTITTPHLEVAPDFTLDWCDHFEGEPGRRGRQLRDPGEWNGRLLPELCHVERRIKSETTDRLVRARGAARLSAWLAFGFTFSEAAGYTLEVEQRVAGGRAERWRSDAPASHDFCLDEVLVALPGAGDGVSDTLAVGLAITDDLERDVVRDLGNVPRASHLLILRPRTGPSTGALRHAGDATALSAQTKRAVRRAVREHGARRVLLYYCGPLAGACFVGHRLNAVAREVVAMEDQQPGYAPSFTLT
jgi:hypothetical protein